MENKLHNFRIFLTVVFLSASSTIFGQLTGVKTIPGTYATVSAAVAAVNASGVGAGGVTFNVAANYTETIAATISLTATGTLANPIIFQKDASTSGSNPLITAYTTGAATPGSATQDGIWRLLGSDYVTIDGIDVKDNPSNTTNPSTMEYGYALYKATTSNGCQNVTIKNCVITLNNINNATGTAPMVDGSSGIIVMNALAASATTAVVPIAGGTNSNNKFYSNTIQNCNTGIAVIGYAAASPFTLADANNDIGGASALTGNTIINYGGASGAANPAVAIRTLAQQGLNVSYNTINNNNGGGTNHPNTLRGIYINTATSANATINYNTITVKGGGTTQNITGIENASGSTPAANTVSITNNTITNCSYTTATTGGFYGILNSGTPTTLSITSNTISNNSSAATSTGFLYGIFNTGAASAVAISSNIFSGNSTSTLTTGLFVGIYNNAATPSLTINSNTFNGNTTTAATGVHYPIYNTGAVSGSININSNNIGTALSDAITFNAANSGSQVFVYNTGGTAAAALSISNNTFQRVNYSVAGTGANTYILNSAATLSQAINSNTFTNLNVNTSGNVTFISNNVVVPGTGTQNVNSNSISGTFSKSAGGTLTLFTSGASSASGSVINNNSNNFSNITVSGTTVISGWVNTDAGASTKTIQNNTFSNWTGGTGSITAMSVNITGTNNATTGNAINTITSSGAITGIATAAGNDKIYSNTINSFTTSGASVVNGISVTSGTSKNIYNNKIYDLQSGGAAGTVNGIIVSGAATAVVTANIYNNLIGDLRVPAGNAADAVRAISVTSTRANSTINVYYNTVYLSASSTGTNFGTSGIYHTSNGTATTATLNLRNNLIANYSTPNGTGLVVAYRRSSTVLTNYASTSNNNLFYAGTPAANKLIFYDGTNSDQTLTTYKARVSAKDAQSVTEDISGTFLSTSGASSSFLHLDPTKSTQAESGAVNITGFTSDFEADVRQGNAGYIGSGSAPDIGADEFSGIQAVALSGTYTVGAGADYTSLTKTGGLFAAINSLGLSGNVVVNITSDLTEDGTNGLNQWTETGVGNYTLTIQPDAAAVRTISGSVATGMIRLNGADRTTIDGSFGGSGNYLTFTNTNTGGTTATAFTFISGATNDIIKYSTLQAYANATNGVVLFSTSAVAGGNSNNTITNCNIVATVGANSGNLCIYSAGTAANPNSSNTISNNIISNYKDRAIDITATGSTGWTISGNSFYNGDVAATINYASASTLHGIRILGGAGYSILNNYIGGNATLASGTSAAYSSTLGNISFQGILLTTSGALPASNIKGNTIASVSMSVTPNVAAASNVFIGIETNGSGINIGGSTAGEGNLIGSNTINGSVSVTTTTALATYLSNIRGINCASTGGAVIGNQVGGIDIKNIGAVPAPSTFMGIYVSNATAPSQVNSNIIGSNGIGAASNSIRVLASSTSPTTLLRGIAIGAVTSTVQADANIVKNMSIQSTTAITNGGGLIGISSAGTGAASVSITNNTIQSNSINLYTTGAFYGVSNTGAASSVSMNSNTIVGNSSSSATGLYYAVLNSGAVTSAININSNNIGNSTTGAFTFNVANSGAQVFIGNTGGTGAAALSISNNNFQGINYAVAGTGSNTYISNTAATLSQAISSNTFTSLSVNTTGSVTFISNNVVVSGSGTQNINSNSISGTFAKTSAGGSVTLFTSGASSLSGSVINNNNNNFSNITVTGATTISGWVNTDAGASTKTIQNNTFTNWTGGTNGITAMSVNVTGTNNATTGNVINNISSAAAITGIATNAGNDNIYLNTINTLSTTGASAVTGISVTGGTTKNIYRNKIYDLQSNNAAGTVNGILVSGATVVTTNIYNNIIGDLRAPATNSVNDAVRGISITSTAANSVHNVYYNSIYLNATSTGINFNTSGVYHTVSATSTTSALNLINNIITNISTPKGSGFASAFHRSGASLNNYSATSNTNLFYAGIPGAKKVIFYDGTNSDQTLAAYKTRVSSRDALSVTEDLTAKFLSTTSSSAVFLHITTGLSTSVESAATPLTNFTNDFDGQVRAGNPGYTGMSATPDIGADEVFGLESIPPVITYTPLSNTTSTLNRFVTGVSITDASGINISAGTKPRIYYKRSTDANAWVDNTSGTNGWKYTEATNSSSPFTFTIDYNLLNGGNTNLAGTLQYFIVAQDVATTANIAINSGIFAAPPTSVGLTSAAFPITGTINSYTISFSGTYNVGTGQTFTSLTRADGLFASINSSGLNNSIVVNITSDLSEDGLVALNQWTETGAGNYTLTIQPDAATTRTISGNVIGGLIRFDGADRVTIDGSFSGGGNYLNFTNTNTAGTTGTAFTFLNGATDNSLKNSTLLSFANATNGVVLFGTSSVSGGNSSNLIDNCSINGTSGSNTSSVGIYSSGTNTAGYENSANTIANNNIYNYQDRGLDITATGSTGWTISGNSFYNGSVSGAINYSSSSALHGVRISGGSGYSISGNYIGGSASLATGSNAVYGSTSGDLSYEGILLNTSSGTPASVIKGNTINKISVSSLPSAANSVVFTGIETSGTGIDIGGSGTGEGNTIGSNSANGAIIVTTSTTSTANTSLVTGINCISSGGVVLFNQVAGFDIKNIGSSPAASHFKGIYVNNASGASQINHNIIGSNGGSAVTNSVRVLSTSTSLATTLAGIEAGTSLTSALQIDNNIIQNISNLSTTSSGSFTGINNNSSSSGATISNNTISNISAAANASASSAIYTGISSASASTINDNTLDNIIIAATGTASQIIGISVSGANVHTILENVLSNFSAASTKTSHVQTGDPNDYNITGIVNSASVAGQVISGNTLSDFKGTTTSASTTGITGIGIAGSGSGNIYDNRIVAFTNKATASALLPGISGIMAFEGSYNAYNNVIKIDNGSNTNGLKIYGINHATANNWNYYHNTISISGNASGTATRSAAFIRTVNGAVLLRNNVFVNTRTGTGSRYAISNIVVPANSNWASTASDYNNFYSSDTTTTTEWGPGVPETFIQWKSISGGDANSASHLVKFLASTYDLEPDPVSNCTLDNTGTPITSPVVINTDINAVTRSATTPDLGAYEFSFTPFIVTAGNNSPVCSGSLVSLTADPGSALNPTYSWTDANDSIVSTLQNPDVAALTTIYTVKVTDENGCFNTASTTVTLTPRPTGTISGPTSVCSGGSSTISIAVTGTGPYSGTLSSGDTFNGNGPTITVNVTPSSPTTYTIATLSDAVCTSQPSDLLDSVVMSITQSGQWTGAMNTDWDNAGNWCGGIPTTTTDVTIPAGLSNYPVTESLSSAHDITIASGASLTVDASTLQISGTINNSGIFNTVNGGIEMNGSTPQTIPANVFTNNTILNLIVSNDVTLAGQDSVTGTISFPGSSKTLSTGDMLTLKSTAAGTGRVANTGNNTISGKVTVERFIAARRSWQLLTAPLSSSGAPTINAAWQEGALNAASNPHPGFGTHITGGTSANGFDQNANNSTSIKQYTNGAWAGLANTNATAVTNQPGYFVFVRGSRSNNLAAGASATADNTVLRATGQLKTGTQSYTAAANGFVFRGNPYASRINFHTISKTVDDHYYLWDPALTGSNGVGGYVTLVWNGSGYSASPNPISAIDLNGGIESGSAFFIDVLTGNTFDIHETDKVAGGTVNRPSNIASQLRTSLNAFNADGTKSMEDGALFLYDNTYSNAIDGGDARKIPNTAENLGIKKQSTILSIEKRKPLTSADTLFFNMTQMRVKSYEFEFNAENLNASGLTGFIQDSYSNTEKAIDLTGTTTYSFNVINVPGSWNPERFRIVFRPLNVLPVTFNTLKASQQNNVIEVEWKVENEKSIKQYIVERSADGRHFIQQQLIDASTNTASGNYKWPDQSPLKNNNYYRIKGMDVSGAVTFSNIVKVNMFAAKSGVEIYPNPVVGELITVQFNNMPAGSYSLKLLNSLGQTIIGKTIDRTQSNSIETIPLNKSMPKGIYHFEITKPSKDKMTYKLIR